MDRTTTEAISYSINYFNVALALLERCLIQNGALGKGQFEAELRATIEAPGAHVDRLDYLYLRGLLQVLEGARQLPLESAASQGHPNTGPSGSP